MTWICNCDRCGKTIEGRGFSLTLSSRQNDLKWDLCDECAEWFRGSMKVRE